MGLLPTTESSFVAGVALSTLFMIWTGAALFSRASLPAPDQRPLSG